MGTTGMSAYHTSKHAVIGLMRCAAMEGGPHGIRVNTVNPGPTETRMMRSIEDMRIPGRGEEIKHQLERRSLDGRYGEPEEVARMMLFLCSDEAAPT
jgi:NAD(P)-dependent dehydrogenase (short-subunit alcohol dehydrogenase family)